ncbi:MAG: DUF1572 family protein [Bacteroidota bacterium]
MNSYLSSAIKQFQYYKSLGEKAIDQLDEDMLFWQSNSENNSIGILVNHLNGNMLSRWTDFLESDGEKEWRTRDAEFENSIRSKKELLEKWEEGWTCLFSAIEPLEKQDLEKEVFIRNMGHSVVEAINRQLCHYSYHIGQIVQIAKIVQGENWKSLSIPKGESKAYNEGKFAKEKRKTHFTDDL